MTMPVALGVVPGLYDVAMMRYTVKQGCGHFCINEYAGPLCEDQIGCDDYAGMLVKM